MRCLYVLAWLYIAYADETDAKKNQKNTFCYQSTFPEEDAHGHKVTGMDPKPAYTDGDLEALIDNLLKEMDTNFDGYVTYSEYRMGS